MEVNELGTKEKELFGQGIEHKIFPSKKNPNAVFKVGHKDTVDEWFEVFRSDPKIFPKVFKSGKMQDKDIYYVMLEKLDSKKFQDKWDELELALEDVGILDVDRGESFSDLYMNEGSDAEVFKEIGKRLSKHDSRVYNFFIEFLDLIKKCEKTILKVQGKDTVVDVHKYNFGYSKDNLLKCLDI